MEADYEFIYRDDAKPGMSEMTEGEDDEAETAKQ